jgi:hypothetical protein
LPVLSKLCAALAALTLALAPSLAAAQPPGAPGAPAEPEGPRPGPFLAASVGGGILGDAAPGLTGNEPGLRGHLELGYGDGRFASGALSLALGRTRYDNNQPPPGMVQPDANLSVNRIGFGAVGEGRLPLGRVVPILGAGLYVDRTSASASGALLGIRGEYFETSDISIGAEARAGVDLRIHSAVELGLRGGWSWSRADLDELTSGAAWLSGPWVELRVTFDASGFRMAPSQSHRGRRPL